MDPQGTPLTADGDALLRAFLGAANWTDARAIVQANPWLLTLEAEERLARLAEEATEQAGDAAKDPVLRWSKERLAAARLSGLAAAFDECEAWDRQFTDMARSLDAASLARALHADASLCDRRHMEALVVLLLRSINPGASEIEGLAPLIDTLAFCGREGPSALLRAGAAQIADELRAIPENQATARIIAECELALQFIASERGSLLWLDLQLRLGSLLLECPEGKPLDNIRRATKVYRDALSLTSRTDSHESWVAAAHGLANALEKNPDARSAGGEEAIAMFELLVDDARSFGDESTLASHLLSLAGALWGATAGDRMQRLEQAFASATESVQLLSRGRDSERWNAPRWGRAKYTLGLICMDRRRGLPAQNVDMGIAAFRDALTVRTVESDPIGRARTLHALAQAYPRWAGADSPAHAARLAAEARSEADEITRNDPRTAARRTGWASFARQASALRANLEWIDSMHPAVPEQWLDGMIAQHREALAATARDQLPVRWAEWMGGIGRLLGLLARVRQECLLPAFQHLIEATEVEALADQPLLRRDLYGCIGSLAHEFGVWEHSLIGNADALRASDELLARSGATESREQVIEGSRQYAFMAAYAAARLGRPLDAAGLAEHGCSRTLAEAAAADEAALSGVSASQRTAVREAGRRVRDLERSVSAIGATGRTAEAARIGARLADHVGVDPSMFTLRVIGASAEEDAGQSAEFARMSARLQAARAELRDLLEPAGCRGAFTRLCDGAAIQAIAARAGYPVIYLIPSTYGSVAVMVPPTGEAESLFLAGITSKDTRRLLHGAEHQPGLVDVIMGSEGAAATVIPRCVDELLRLVAAPLDEWLVARGHRRAAVASMGSFALLPVRNALETDGPALSFIPSARVLGLALARLEAIGPVDHRYLGVADPGHDDSAPLPFAVAEVRSACSRLGTGRTEVLVGAAASRTAVTSGLRRANVLHFACHGVFRPSQPRDSELQLAGNDTLSLGDFMSGDVPLEGVRVALLSACQTATVEFRRLPDEALGFPASLLLAGAAGVVAAMWPVFDDSAALFFDRFLELHAAGVDAATATREAQRWLARLTAPEARARVAAMRAALGPGDGEADVALGELDADLAADDQIAPFADPVNWAAFAYCGA